MLAYHRLGVSLAFCVGCLGLLCGPARADIKNWQTGQTIPGTEAITPGPGMYLSYWNTPAYNLRYGDFSGGLDLNCSNFHDSWFDNARFGQANLTGADFAYAKLTKADLTDAVVSKASFSFSNGFTKEQLYSTASYKGEDLQGIRLEVDNLSGWNFAGQNLTGASLAGSTLASANLSQANLTGANFNSATLTNVKLIDAVVTKANFASSPSFTKEQLYSTANYKA